jgi:hypothetical protein
MTFIRCIIAGTVGFLVGGVSGCVASSIFISTPLQRIMGQRFAEFDFLGVIGVTVGGALVAGVAATVAAAARYERIRSTFEARNLLVLMLAPTLVLVLLTFTVSGEWAWLVLIHLSACLGILAGAGCALFIRRAASSKPDHFTKRARDSNGL